MKRSALPLVLGVGLGADVLEPEPFAGAIEGKGFVAGAVVGRHASDRHAEAVVIGAGGLRKAIALFAFSSGMIMVKAMREASSMQTWTNSQPAPSPLARALLCPLRSPVMRWPTWWKRPSFLMSMWMSSPGCWRS